MKKTHLEFVNVLEFWMFSAEVGSGFADFNWKSFDCLFSFTTQWFQMFFEGSSVRAPLLCSGCELCFQAFPELGIATDTNHFQNWIVSLRYKRFDGS